MKQQFVENLQEGDQVSDYFVATRKDLRTQQSGGKFLGMVFKDRTGDIGGILWNNAPSVASVFEVGDVVTVRGSVTSYQERLQIRVEQVLPLREGEYDPADLVFLPEDSESIRTALLALLDSIKNEWLAGLVKEFLDDDTIMTAFAGAGAGKKWHHAFPGGLIKHCYEMARIVETMCELFPTIDRDLLLSAVFLHDIGKVEEMSHDLCIDYTNAGKLLGHLTIGSEMVQRRIAGIDGFPDSLRLQLAHCILSHHGELTNGSPIVPKTLEAVVLHHIDNLDAQTDAIVRVMEETSRRGQAWSEFLPQIQRYMWTKEGE